MAAEQPSKRAKTGEEGRFSLNFDFTATNTLDPTLTWLNPPVSATFEGAAGLKVVPEAGSDFWCKTYMVPPANRASGHALLYAVSPDVQRCVVQTDFSLKDYSQYDQAGIMVYVDDRHWLKAGLEMEQGEPKMSCVVTNQESDWNYKAWPTKAAQVRATVKRYSGICDCNVEYMDEGGAWCFLRDAYIVLPSPEVEVKAGLLVAAPKKEEGGDGMEAFFKSLSIEGE